MSRYVNLSNFNMSYNLVVRERSSTDIGFLKLCQICLILSAIRIWQHKYKMKLLRLGMTYFIIDFLRKTFNTKWNLNYISPNYIFNKGYNGIVKICTQSCQLPIWSLWKCTGDKFDSWILLEFFLLSPGSTLRICHNET